MTCAYQGGPVIEVKANLPPVPGEGGRDARRAFDVIDLCDTLVHWHADRSKSEIAETLGVAGKTICRTERLPTDYRICYSHLVREWDVYLTAEVKGWRPAGR